MRLIDDAARASGLLVVLIAFVACGSNAQPQFYPSSSSQSRVDSRLGSISPLTKGSWTTEPSMIGGLRDLAAGFANHVIILVGGDDNGSPSGATSETWYYEPYIKEWAISTSMPDVRAGLIAAGVGTTLYAIGGQLANGDFTGETDAYSTYTIQWSVEASMRTARANAAEGVVNGIVYVVGGNTATSVLATNEAYNPSTNRWREEAPMPTARTELAVGVVRGKLYAVGGQDASGNPLGTVEEYNPRTNTWQERATMPIARQAAVAGVIGNLLYVAGGYNGGSGQLSSVEAYSPSRNKWREKAPDPTSRSNAAAAVVPGMGQMYVFGGTTPSQCCISTNETFEP
jgi:N-acetylneuraminic acid mutarotase